MTTCSTVIRAVQRWSIGIVLLLCMACGTHKKETVETAPRSAFYYWQTDLNSFPWNDSFYKSLHVHKVYYRFFDVGWSEEVKAPVPLSPLITDSYRGCDSVEMVPVVFITNETFKNIDTTQVVALARQVHHKIMSALTTMLMYDVKYGTGLAEVDLWEHDPYQISSAHFDEQRKYDSIYNARIKTISEIQFDCDWTSATKQNYFTFLKAVKLLFAGRKISATIRLYQFKYPDKAGLPPVDRGMLMCYNTGDVRDGRTENSIFDKKEIMSYLDAKPYPIALDYALPVFEWALLYRDGQLKDILSSSTLHEDYAEFIQTIDSRHSIVTKDFVYGYTAASTLIRAGDQIRWETPNPYDVADLAQWLAEHKNNQEAILSLYHLNQYDLEKNANAIKNIFRSF